MKSPSYVCKAKLQKNLNKIYSLELAIWMNIYNSFYYYSQVVRRAFQLYHGSGISATSRWNTQFPWSYNSERAPGPSGSLRLLQSQFTTRCLFPSDAPFSPSAEIHGKGEEGRHGQGRRRTFFQLLIPIPVYHCTGQRSYLWRDGRGVPNKARGP